MTPLYYRDVNGATGPADGLLITEGTSVPLPGQKALERILAGNESNLGTLTVDAPVVLVGDWSAPPAEPPRGNVLDGWEESPEGQSYLRDWGVKYEVDASEPKPWNDTPPRIHNGVKVPQPSSRLSSLIANIRHWWQGW